MRISERDIIAGLGNGETQSNQMGIEFFDALSAKLFTEIDSCLISIRVPPAYPHDA